MKRNLGDWALRAGALGLALLLWLHAVTEQTYLKELAIVLQVDNPAKDASSNLIIANSLPQKVQVVFSGKGKDLLRLKDVDFVLRFQVDEDDLKRGDRRTISLSTDQIQNLQSDKLPTIKITEIKPPNQIELVFDQEVEKEIYVKPVVSLEAADSYTQVGDLEFQPKTIIIKGPREQIRRVNYIKTDSLVLENLRADVERMVRLLAPKNTRIQLSHKSVHLKVKIQELAEFTIQNIPVKVKGADSEYLVPEPSKVKIRVKGGADIIGHLNPENDIDLFVDYDTGMEKETFFKISAVRPKLFEIKEITPPYVTLTKRVNP